MQAERAEDVGRGMKRPPGGGLFDVPKSVKRCLSLSLRVFGFC
jgi:hypothetical protein